MPKQEKDRYITRVNRINNKGNLENYFWVRFERSKANGKGKYLEAHKCFPCKTYAGVRKAQSAAREWRDAKLRQGIRDVKRIARDNSA